jgi:hypothetical protein
MHKALVRFSIALLFCTVAAGQQTVRIGQGVVALTGPWKFHTGDNPRWADPRFEDSSWENVDLTPTGAMDYYYGSLEFVPGWTARGHPQYWGYAWYRLKLQIEPGNAPLFLLMPLLVDDGYEVYANGRAAGHFGDLKASNPVTYINTAKWFPLPATEPGQVTVLAVRFYMQPSTLIGQGDPGGMHGPPRIGEASIIVALANLWRQRFMLLSAAYLLEAVVFIGFTGALFALWWLDRAETVYLWFASAYLALFALELFRFTEAAVPELGGELGNFGYLLEGCTVFFLISAWWRWFELKEKRWLIRLVLLAVLIWIAASLCTVRPASGTLAPVAWLPGLHALMNLARLAIGLLFGLIVVFGVRLLRREGWMALPAAVLFSISLFSNELELLHIPSGWQIFGVQVRLRQIADIALSAVLGILIIRRFQRSQRRKQQLEADLRQAQQVQQVLLPQAIPKMPGFRIECEYRPAQEVGGDFFQVLETRGGGVLVAIGDVSGKGVHAAMLVALIVGALRTIAEESEEPQTIVGRLNRRLVGRMEGGFASCLCALIAADGATTVANAGHLTPWLSGEEIDIPHDLPLGISEAVEYTSTHLQIPENSTLTFVSDGVVEARNGQKELFGFDRVRALSARPAARIADAAQEFGQQDDITVVTIQRVPVPAYA